MSHGLAAIPRAGLGMVIALALAGASVQAGTAEGYEAGHRGDYAIALREFQPAA